MSRFAPVTLPKKHDVRHHGGPLPLERIRGQPNGSDEIRLVGEVFTNRGVLLVECEMGRDQSQDAAGFQGIDRLGEEVVVQGEFLAVMVEREIRERDVADHSVDTPLGEFRVPKTLDANVVLRMDCPCNAAGDRIHLHADEPLSRLAVAQEIADAAARFQDRAISIHAQATDGFVDTADDDRRRVEGIECRAFGTVVFVWGEERL
ncbi:MAG: hypothetical protein LC104_06000 [Bacteroidales bacterium]|nr:hypothetical protein [Bacteroidales bacterium]